ncbi:MAG: nickel ABC transporter substrate-binding protein [Deltaproteobacteria bacterium]|jgi:nickel transport system substrate-binding protein|nr:nickel ABC transporter substrate-binding protein [Deltaproteobacteria bacterium]
MTKGKPRVFCSKAMVLALAALFGAFWAVGQAKAQNVDRGETLVFSFPKNAGTPNPHEYGPSQMYSQVLVYEPLVTIDHAGKIVPCLAESWEISEDGKTYLFKLKEGVVFSDGEPFTAEVAVLNFKTVMDNAAEHNWLGVVNFIESFRAVSPNEFELKLKSPYSPTLMDLATPRPFRFVSPKVFPEDGDTFKSQLKADGGTGPWKKAETALGEYDLFERNDLYWGEKTKTKYLLVKVIPDPIGRAMAFEAGEIDIIYGDGQINFDVFDRFSKTPGVEAKVSPPMVTMALALNTAKEPTKELAVRQALEHVVDKKEVSKGVSLSAFPPADYLLSPDIPYCKIDSKPFEFDPQKAAKILDEAGWVLAPGETVRKKDGKELVIDFCFVGNNANQKSIAEIIQAQAAKIGMKLNLIGEEEDSFYKRQNSGEFNMIVSATWGPPYDPHTYMASMLIPSHADYAAQSGLAEKPKIDELINLALTATEEKDRSAHYKEIITILHDRAVYLPLYYQSLLMVYRSDRLSGASFGPTRYEFPFGGMSVK